MLYQIGLILILVVIALIIGKKLKKSDNANEQLIFEDDMTEEELKKLDEKDKDITKDLQDALTGQLFKRPGGSTDTTKPFKTIRRDNFKGV